jgi:pimeloyl-ACP methyl ester carboxylesterase
MPSADTSLVGSCSGTGSPTVVLNVGLGATPDLLDGLLASVSETTKVCVYARAGLGGSPALPVDAADPSAGAQADQLLETLEEEGIEGPYVVHGWSYGGIVAQAFANRHPELVAGVVLEDPPYFALLDPRRNHDAHWYQGWLRIRELLRARLDPAGFRAAVGELPAMIPGEGLRLRDVLGELEVAARAEVLRRVDAAVLDPVIEDRLLRGFPAAAFELRCPAALIAGSWRLGGVMTSEDVQRWLEHVPHGTATVLGDAGHLIHHRPDSRRAVLWHLGEVGRRVDVRDRGFADSYGLDAAERNRQLAREEFEVWSTGELERLDSLVA